MLFDSNGITLAAGSRLNQGHELYKTEYIGEDMEMIINVAYFRQILSCIDEDTFDLKVYGGGLACIITTQGKYNNQYAVMPLLDTPETANLSK